MRADTSFSDRKLTIEEFRAKYWLGGRAPYQYHTARIEDGRDEREQLVFNNLRALFELDIFRETNLYQPLCRRVRELERRQKRITAIAVIIAVGYRVLLTRYIGRKSREE